MDSALDIRTGAELERFDLGEVVIGKHTRYQILTGYESPPQDGVRRCFWCGGALKGKLKRYCRGHMQDQYYRHFEWNTASGYALKRAGWACENCGVEESHEVVPGYSLTTRTNLEVHHIVPLVGARRDFSAFNLPWNLIVLCHACHLEIHAAMRPSPPTTWERATGKGQGVMPLAF